jgi:dihydrolipoamide dehydrogenase
MVDKFYQTNVAGIYAIGDCVPGQALAHVASKEGIICVENIGFNEKKYNHKPSLSIIIMFRDVLIAILKLPLLVILKKQAKDAGYEIKVGKFH